MRWGLGAASVGSRKHSLPLKTHLNVEGAYGHAVEVSSGKDTPSGHWEICGLPVPFEWGTFPEQENCFPAQLMQDLLSQGNIEGTLANKHSSGTEVLVEFGEEHLRTGFPICYTSADSVFQIAAHEESFGLERLYALCEVAKKLVDPLNVTRVIARPFKGTCGANFERTANRRDLTTPPVGPTLLDHIQDQQDYNKTLYTLFAVPPWLTGKMYQNLNQFFQLRPFEWLFFLWSLKNIFLINGFDGFSPLMIILINEHIGRGKILLQIYLNVFQIFSFIITAK